MVAETLRSISIDTMLENAKSENMLGNIEPKKDTLLKQIENDNLNIPQNTQIEKKPLVIKLDSSKTDQFKNKMLALKKVLTAYPGDDEVIFEVDDG